MAADEGIAQYAKNLGIDAEAIEVERCDRPVEILQSSEVPRDEGPDSFELKSLLALRVGVVRARQSNLEDES